MGKKIFATVLAAAMLFSITGCHMVFTNEELDKEQVIAVVNGTEIKKETFLKDYQFLSHSLWHHGRQRELRRQ